MLLLLVRLCRASIGEVRRCNRCLLRRFCASMAALRQAGAVAQPSLEDVHYESLLQVGVTHSGALATSARAPAPQGLCEGMCCRWVFQLVARAPDACSTGQRPPLLPLPLTHPCLRLPHLCCTRTGAHVQTRALCNVAPALW